MCKKRRTLVNYPIGHAQRNKSLIPVMTLSYLHKIYYSLTYLLNCFIAKFHLNELAQILTTKFLSSALAAAAWKRVCSACPVEKHHAGRFECSSWTGVRFSDHTGDIIAFESSELASLTLALCRQPPSLPRPSCFSSQVFP